MRALNVLVSEVHLDSFKIAQRTVKNQENHQSISPKTKQFRGNSVELIALLGSGDFGDRNGQASAVLWGSFSGLK